MKFDPVRQFAFSLPGRHGRAASSVARLPVHCAARLRTRFCVLLAALLAASLASAEPRLPLPSGNYTFQHRYSEQPDISGMHVLAKIEGRHIVLVNKVPSGGFPVGVIAEGTLMWHARLKQWIIGNAPSDRYAREAGGCSEGPEVVDLRRKIYWTC